MWECLSSEIKIEWWYDKNDKQIVALGIQHSFPNYFNQTVEDSLSDKYDGDFCTKKTYRYYLKGYDYKPYANDMGADVKFDSVKLDSSCLLKKIYASHFRHAKFVEYKKKYARARMRQYMEKSGTFKGVSDKTKEKLINYAMEKEFQ